MSTGSRPQTTSVNRANLKRVIYQHRGQEHAISSKELAGIFGTEATNIRDAVQDLVRDGALIASSPDGYYRIASVDEVRSEIRSLLDDANTRRERARTLREEWQRLEEELGVPGESPVKSPSGAIVAAEIAVGEGNLELAENALLESLSRVRRTRQEGRA